MSDGEIARRTMHTPSDVSDIRDQFNQDYEVTSL